MILPLVEGGTLGKYSTSLALRVYDFLAGVDKEDRRKMLSVKAALKKEPLLNPSGLKGAGYYAEYRTDDARLTIELAKKAVSYGAVVLNYMEVSNFQTEDGKISGVVCNDVLDGKELKITSKNTSLFLVIDCL